MTKLAVALTVACVAFCAPARANCARDVADIRPVVAKVQDKLTKERAQDYLNRAERELQENDEFECASAISALQKLVAKPASKP